MKELNSVSGKLTLLAIIGDPIAQVRAPLMINAAIEAQHIPDTLMVPLHVSPGSVQQAIEGLKAVQNFAGAIITMPHKKEVMRFVDSASTSATRCGACNVIRRDQHGKIHGTMLDGEGFVASLLERDIAVRQKKIYLAGTGGAGTAIAHALAAHQVAELVIYNRTASRAEALIRELSVFYPQVQFQLGNDKPAEVDIAINATSVGMGETQELPFSLMALNPPAVVCDIIIFPETTALLAAAQQRNLCTHSGRAMLAAQIALMLEFMLHGKKA
ncbi:shikimate dehydrogenase [Kosakonia oryzae]|uniref:shikimate dehydrogenase (NADP(+)) n=2 Tax=Kosakonia oryzae TaxID=497725 RepID=A0AA94H174_9ENTR|nr:shikimate dehydrogenase [Kosakonia oryzae]ANI83541.1 shikimate dehydrogenase [Kosakonia oryzae]SFB84145.1 shikimate dehydrogenase [Kosakonia oryzae]